ncbi:MAG TPA: hypothetical protein VND45_11065 [Thermoanaerobaculia bacterium]|jgi:hypothetical protein|nr:hypothetical protein [Thermoanaerobaculia bacterium]
MTDHASPATRLHDVVVVQEQTRAEWRAGDGSIRDRHVVVRAGRMPPPPSFFAVRAATYSVRATDGAGRSRHFPHLTLLADESRPPQEYVFD